MLSRYGNRRVVVNDTLKYKDVREERNVKFFRQYATPQLKHPTSEDIVNLTTVKKVWKVGSKLFKYANEFYGDPRFWWIIAWFNQKPTEADFKIGDIVEIPVPLEEILTILDV